MLSRSGICTILYRQMTLGGPRRKLEFHENNDFVSCASRGAVAAGFSMNFRSVAGRLRRGEFHYALGRFKTVRASYSGLQRLRGLVGRAPEMRGTGRSTLFPKANVDCGVGCMGVGAGFV